MIHQKCSSLLACSYYILMRQSIINPNNLFPISKFRKKKVTTIKLSRNIKSKSSQTQPMDRQPKRVIDRLASDTRESSARPKTRAR